MRRESFLGLVSGVGIVLIFLMGIDILVILMGIDILVILLMRIDFLTVFLMSISFLVFLLMRIDILVILLMSISFLTVLLMNISFLVFLLTNIPFMFLSMRTPFLLHTVRITNRIGNQIIRIASVDWSLVARATCILVTILIILLHLHIPLSISRNPILSITTILIAIMTINMTILHFHNLLRQQLQNNPCKLTFLLQTILWIVHSKRRDPSTETVFTAQTHGTRSQTAIVMRRK